MSNQIVLKKNKKTLYEAHNFGATAKKKIQPGY